MAELGFEITTPGFTVRCATDCAIEPGLLSDIAHDTM